MPYRGVPLDLGRTSVENGPDFRGFIGENWGNTSVDKVSYCTPFLEFVERFGDPYECWQEDGFWPDRVDSPLEYVLVWGTEIGLSYLNNGGMVAYLQFISGRTLPEMERGFDVLKCSCSHRVCNDVRRRFGKSFPRSDAERSAFVAMDEPYFEKSSQELWDAMKLDDYERIAEEYYRKVCVANSIPPYIYPKWT